MFDRYIAIDYSGRGRPAERTSSLAVCSIDVGGAHGFPCANDGVNWNREDLAQWLLQQFQNNHGPTLVGIDHAFSFPIEYFRRFGLPEGQWDHLLVDFVEHWPTHEQRVVDLRAGNPRTGAPQWRRLTDNRAKGAQGVFDFDGSPVQAQVATSTHAGLPWLLHIRQALLNAGAGVHFWPFDGWDVPEGNSAVVEVYPAFWNWRFGGQVVVKYNHQRDAYSVAIWMWEQDQHDLLGQYFGFGMPQEDRLQAQTEGWIFGLLW